VGSTLKKDARSWHERMQTPNEGVVIGQILNNVTEYAAVGRMSQTADLVDPETLFEIGSITKIFTGILLADTILQNKAALDDAIVMHLPKGIFQDNNPLARITLLELATHTSGLPRLPSDFSEGSDSENPYKHYTRDKMFEYLSNIDKADLVKQGEYAYSNLGFGLLGEVLAYINNTTYTELLQKVILDPLKMRDTYVQTSIKSIPNRLKEKFAVGHDKGKPTAHWTMTAFAGAGGIVSTASDLLIFSKAQWDVETPMKLQKAFDLAAKQHTDQMGLGWHRTPEGLSHGGGTGGFRTRLDVSIINKTARVKLQNGTGPQHKLVRKGNFKEITGFWKGTLDAKGGKLDLVMRLTPEGDARMYSIDQGGGIISALITEFENNTFFAFFPAVNGSYTGTVSEGKLIVGTWKQNRKIPLKMKKSDKLPKSLKKIFKKRFKGNFDKLIGFWSGSLGDSKDLFIICEVEKIDKVYELNIWSLNHNPLPIPISKVKYHDNSLLIKVKSINGSFNGQLSENGKTINGIWNQGTEQVVTLNRSAVRPKSKL
jgi:CubicO group peptidase (beta-lactamase class C family)